MDELSDEEVEHLQDVLVEHGSVYGAGNCHICGESRCPIWVEAYDRLAAAGKPMVEPGAWEQPGQ